MANNAKGIQGVMKHGLYAIAGGTFGILVGFGGGLAIATIAAAAGITPLIGLSSTTLLAAETVIGLGLGTMGGAIVSYMEDLA